MTETLILQSAPQGQEFLPLPHSLSQHTHLVAADAGCPIRSGLALWGDECAFVGSKGRTQTATDRQAALEEGLMAEGKKGCLSRQPYAWLELEV